MLYSVEVRDRQSGSRFYYSTTRSRLPIMFETLGEAQREARRLGRKTPSYARPWISYHGVELGADGVEPACPKPAFVEEYRATLERVAAMRAEHVANGLIAEG